MQIIRWTVLPVLAALGFSTGAASENIFPFALESQLGEQPVRNEQAVFAETRDILLRFMQEHYGNPDTRALRDFHAKAHGCVRGDFRVRDDLPESWTQGLFVAGQEYPAIIRFSNGDSAISGDRASDARGMAVKLFGVDGDKLSTGNQNATTHDFVMINRPAFFLRDATQNLAALRGREQGTLGLIWFGVRNPITTWNLFTNQNIIENPLAERYFSMTPYRFGNLGRAVKFSMWPVSCNGEELSWARGSGDNALRDAMKRQLTASPACFAFGIQVRSAHYQRAAQMPVENAQVVWDESFAPFHRLATLVIEPQDFDTVAKNQTCENLAFNPWHAIPEHRPLGSINRVRKVVYEAISDWRRDHNGVTKREPESIAIWPEH